MHNTTHLELLEVFFVYFFSVCFRLATQFIDPTSWNLHHIQSTILTSPFQTAKMNRQTIHPRFGAFR